MINTENFATSATFSRDSTLIKRKKRKKEEENKIAFRILAYVVRFLKLNNFSVSRIKSTRYQQEYLPKYSTRIKMNVNTAFACSPFQLKNIACLLANNEQYILYNQGKNICSLILSPCL